MRGSPEGYWFKSSKFEIEPGEDKDINPRLYGRQLAIWLKQRLEESGYVIEPIINEDWGRCLICRRRPFMLWVGCGSVSVDRVPSKEEVTWHCFAVAEIPFWRRFFGRMNTTSAVSKLDASLRDILTAEPQISVVPAP